MPGHTLESPCFEVSLHIYSVSPHDTNDVPRFLPAGLTQHGFINNRGPNLLRTMLLPKTTSSAAVERIAGHQPVGGHGGVIAVLHHKTRLKKVFIYLPPDHISGLVRPTNTGQNRPYRQLDAQQSCGTSGVVRHSCLRATLMSTVPHGIAPSRLRPSLPVGAFYWYIKAQRWTVAAGQDTWTDSSSQPLLQHRPLPPRRWFDDERPSPTFVVLFYHRKLRLWIGVFAFVEIPSSSSGWGYVGGS